MASGIQELHEFIKGDLRKAIARSYKRFDILSEGDLQCVVWNELRKFVKRLPKADIRVHCLPGVDVKQGRLIHPDVVVFRKNRVWVVVELKESFKRIKETTAMKERGRLLACKEHHNAKRGYLLYVCRFHRDYQQPKALPKRKDEGARYLFEIPIVLEDEIGPESAREWDKEFKSRAKTRIQ